MVSTDGYKNPEALPHPDDVAEAFQTIVEESAWMSGDMLLDVRRENRQIQHEAPPNDPYDAAVNVIVFAQTATDMRTVEGVDTDPFEEAVEGLYRQFSEIELWVDTAQIS